MRSQFQSPLMIKAGKVEAAGELMWEPGEEQSLVSVSISQKQHKVAGMATSRKNFMNPADTNWTLDIKPGYDEPGYDEFKPGVANAVGIICAMGSQVRVFFWSQEVKLKLTP